MKKISAKEFQEKVLDRRIDKIREVLGNKHKEYAFDNDYLINFTSAAKFDDTTPEQINWGYMMKQLVAVRKMVKNPDKVYSKDYIDEKIGDTINYLILLEAILYAKNREK
jgi:hypothetical protein